MDLSKIKAYLKENGFEKGKLAHLSQMLEEAVSDELRWHDSMNCSEVNNVKSQLRDMTIEKEKLEVEVSKLQKKLETPSESFRAQFIACAHELLCLESYDAGDYGSYREAYRLLVDGKEC